MSIEESHPDSEVRRQALNKHWQEVDIIRTALSKAVPELDALILDAPVPAGNSAPVEWFG